MIFLVRHGETEWNAAGRYQGAKDSPLTARGREQARAVGRLLRRLAPTEAPLPAAVSPLGRAQQTAALISEEAPLAPTLEARLAEVSIGCWDGMTDFEIETEYPGRLAGADAHNWFFRSPDGESLDEVIARVSGWLRSMEGPVAAVSHGLTGRIIRGVYLGLSRDEMLALPVPQEGLFLLEQGSARFFPSSDSA